MTAIPTNRTTANSPSEHVSDHNILHHFNNEHPTDPSAHIGTNVANTPAGTIAATDVQGALNELDTEKAPKTELVVDAAGGAHYTTLAAALAAAAAGDTIRLRSDLSIAAVTTISHSGTINAAGHAITFTSSGALAIAASDVTLKDLGILTAAGSSPIQATGTVPAYASPTTTLGANATNGATTLTVASTTGLAAGDYCIVGDSAVPDAANPTRHNGEMVRIKSVDSSTGLTIQGVLRDDYTTARSGALWKITPWTGIRLQRLKILNTSPLSGTNAFVVLTGCVDVEISGGTYDKADGPAIDLESCANVTVTDITARDLADDSGNSRFGYGVNIGGACDGVLVSDSKFGRCRHAVTTNGRDIGFPRNVLVTGCEAAETTNASFDTHPGGGQITYAANSVVGSQDKAFQIRSPQTKVIGNTGSFCGSHGIQFSGAAHGSIAQDNILRHIVGQGITAVAGPAGEVADALVVEGNTVEATTLDSINIACAATRLQILRNRLYNAGIGSTGVGIKFGAVTSTGHRIEGNIGGNVATASEAGVSPGAMANLVVLPSTVTGSYVMHNTAVGLTTATAISDAGGNTKFFNTLNGGLAGRPNTIPYLTSGATLAALETEVNNIKSALWALGMTGANLLSQNASSLETSAADWGFANLNATSVVRSTAQAYDGAASLLITANGSGDASTRTNPAIGTIPVIGGASYLVTAQSRAATTVRGVRTQARWLDSGGALISESSGVQPTNTNSGWTLISNTYVAPATAVAVQLRDLVVAPSAAEGHYFDLHSVSLVA